MAEIFEEGSAPSHRQGYYLEFQLNQRIIQTDIILQQGQEIIENVQQLLYEIEINNNITTDEKIRFYEIILSNEDNFLDKILKFIKEFFNYLTQINR